VSSWLRASLPQALILVLPGAGLPVLEQVPDISLNLCPSILDDLGLEPASGGLHAVAMDRKSSFFLAPH
jgi:hypothetical protein